MDLKLFLSMLFVAQMFLVFLFHYNIQLEILENVQYL